MHKITHHPKKSSLEPSETRKSIFGFMPAPAFPFRASAGTICSVWQPPGMALPSARRLRYIAFSVPQKNGGISYCFFRQNGCRSRRRCLTEGSLAAVASILPEKTVRNPHFLCRTENTIYRSRRTEGSAMPGDCHTERTVPADALNGNAGAGIKPKIDFRASEYRCLSTAAFAARRNVISLSRSPLPK